MTFTLLAASSFNSKYLVLVIKIPNLAGRKTTCIMYLIPSVRRSSYWLISYVFMTFSWGYLSDFDKTLCDDTQMVVAPRPVETKCVLENTTYWRKVHNSSLLLLCSYYFKCALETCDSFRTVKPFRWLALPLQSSVTILSSCSVAAASSTAGHVCWRFFRLDEQLSATSLDHRTLWILIHLLFWLNRTSWNSWRNYSLCHNSSTGGTHTCLIWSSVMLRCSQQKTSLLWK